MWMVRFLHAGPILFGQIGRPERELALLIGVTAAVVAVGVWVIYRVKRWREELAQEIPLSPAEMIDHYQKMVDAGMLDPQEFAQIKAQLEKQPAPPPAGDPNPRPSSNQPPNTSFFEK